MKPTYTKLLKENRSFFLENVKQGKMYVDKGQLDPDILKKIILIDPTPTRKYVGWMAKQWVIGNIDDMNVLTNTVEEYDTFLQRNKALTKDINQFKTFEDLAKEVDYLNQIGSNLSVKDLENDYTVKLDTPELLIIVPHTHEASRKVGLKFFNYRKCEDGSTDSAWCTTYKSPDHWVKYYQIENITLYYIRIRSEEMMNRLKQEFGDSRGEDMRVMAISVDEDGNIVAANDGKDAFLKKDEIDKFTEIIGRK